MTLAIWHLSQTQALALFGALLVLMLAAEMMRRYWPPFGALYNKMLGAILRAHEAKKFTGAFYVVLAAFLAVLFFDKIVAVTALGMMLVSDSMAALIGKKFGKTPLAGKSLEGSLAFFISALGVVWLMGNIGDAPHGFYYAGLASAFAATLTELFGQRIKIDDNLTITLVAGFVMAALNY